MYAVFLHDLGHCLHSAYRLQADLGLELRRVHPTFFPLFMRYRPFKDNNLNYRLKSRRHFILRQLNIDRRTYTKLEPL